MRPDGRSLAGLACRRSALASLAALLLLPACTRDQWQRFPSPDDAIAAVPWFSVMKRSIAIEPYRVAHPGPVPGTVPITGTEVVPPAIPANEATLNRLQNPVQTTAASLERGRDRYQIYCQVCHGAEGLGNGPVAPALANTVRNLTEPRMRARSDGWIYAVISNGFGALMPEYRSKLNREDRWHIVNYVRVLQGVAR